MENGDIRLSPKGLLFGAALNEMHLMLQQLRNRLRRREWSGGRLMAQLVKWDAGLYGVCLKAFQRMAEDEEMRGLVTFRRPIGGGEIAVFILT